MMFGDDSDNQELFTKNSLVHSSEKGMAPPKREKAQRSGIGVFVRSLIFGQVLVLGYILSRSTDLTGTGHQAITAAVAPPAASQLPSPREASPLEVLAQEAVSAATLVASAARQAEAEAKLAAATDALAAAQAVATTADARAAETTAQANALAEALAAQERELGDKVPVEVSLPLAASGGRASAPGDPAVGAAGAAAAAAAAVVETSAHPDSASAPELGAAALVESAVDEESAICAAYPAACQCAPLDPQVGLRGLRCVKGC